MGMTEGVQVSCRRPISGFDTNVYRLPEHGFSNAVVLSESVFSALDQDPYSYVRVVFDDGRGEKTVFAVPFVERYDPTPPVMAISSNLMAAVHPEIDEGDLVTILPTGTPTSRELTVYRPYSDLRAGVCYLSWSVLESIDAEPGDELEIYTPETGGRITLTADTLFEGEEEPHKIRLDLHSTQILDLEFGDTVRVRKLAPDDPASDSILTEPKAGNYDTLVRRIDALTDWIAGRVFETFVGTRRVSLRVVPGLDQDEYRGIIRLSESTMRYLGVETKDQVYVGWHGREVTVQSLPIPDDQEEAEGDALEVLLPSSVRDKLEVNPYDGVQVWRDTRYELQKQVSISLLGILGVVVGTFQIASTTEIAAKLLAAYGSAGTLGALLLLSAVLSIPVIWFLLLPVRGEVRG